MKILNIVGARPNFVKIAPLINRMRKSPDIDPLLVHTGQHYDIEMSDAFFSDLDIPRPNYHLHVQPGSSATQMNEIMGRLEPVMVRERPDIVLVVGDVNSTLAGALAAARLDIPVAHVEAGLRSFDRRMPEEINRVLTDAVSDFLFVTEPSGVENLLREGKPPDRIFLVGNVMIDTLKRALRRMGNGTAPVLPSISSCRGQILEPRYAVLTLHRQGLVDDPALFGGIWNTLQEIGHRIPIIFPVHPRTQLRLRSLGFESLPHNFDGSGPRGIQMIPPLGYLDFLRLQKEAAFVLTDSGGVQEETTALGVPCLTLRENTERPFTVSDGTNKVVGFDPKQILHEANRLLLGKGKRGRSYSLWDGRAAERIVRILLGCFKSSRESRPSQTEAETPAWV
jgi:UDP-N-acetylglucosamine 2-epimerase (non-hydrolysing)